MKIFLQPKNCSINVPCAGNGITRHIVMLHSDVTQLRYIVTTNMPEHGSVLILLRAAQIVAADRVHAALR